ncbi:hypothetical protein C8R48DRAFT_671095 [Suillus tomentosus]|nr:hypothetical protein C8R48DRAFT_671095 [Suillus tomentosus]
MSQMEDDQHPKELSQVDNTPRPPAASPIVVAPTSASENAGQKRKIADLEENLTSGHTLKRQMITLLDNIEDLVGKNGCDKDDDDVHVTLVFSQDRLRIGYVALKTSSDSDSMEHDNHLHMSKRVVGGLSSCGLAARRCMSLSRRWALRRFQKVKDARANADDSEESVSTMYHCANGTPEI